MFGQKVDVQENSECERFNRNVLTEDELTVSGGQTRKDTHIPKEVELINRKGGRGGNYLLGESLQKEKTHYKSEEVMEKELKRGEGFGDEKHLEERCYGGRGCNTDSSLH